MFNSENDDTIKFRKGLSAYSSDYSPFLQSCMLKADFVPEDVDECHDAYQNFATLALRIELRRLNRLADAYKSRVEVPSDGSDLVLTQYVEEEPKMKKAMCNFHIEAASFIVTCMQKGGFEPVETDECDTMHLKFLSHVLKSEIDRLAHLQRFDEKNSSTTDISSTTTTKFTTQEVQFNADSIRNGNDEGEESNKYLHNSVQISKSSLFTLYHAQDSQGSVVMKVLNAETDNEQIMRIQNEFEVCNKIQHQGIRKVLSRTTIEGKQALFLEWIDGKTITQGGKFSVNQFLQVAKEIVSALVALHSGNFIHGNLTTENILFNFDSYSVKLIGLSSSSKWNGKSYTSSVGERMLGSDARFVSPEQTGLINRRIDYRSDFYSLGIIFYSMLFGSPPYNSEKLLDIIHMHLFSDAAPLHKVDTSIPILLSNFVSKLMEKDVEDRYRSTEGIMFDLEMMLTEIANNNSLDSLTLSEQDVPKNFLISQKLYGRSSENDQLLEVFEKVYAGSFELLLITGASGVGKSSFALEIRKPLTKRKGFLIKGGYDQARQKQPYLGLLEAFKIFFDALLTEDGEVFNFFRKSMLNAIGDEGKILTDIWPTLKRIIGVQESVDEIIGSESKNRFQFIFRNLLRSLCSGRYPIVLLLDDLQWADEDSLDLLLALVSDKSIKNLMIIGIYRDEEANIDNHRLSITLSEMKEVIKISTTRIELGTLDNDEINNLLCDTLLKSPLETFPLTVYIKKRTDGNALYVKLFLEFLAKEGFLFLCQNSGKWRWKDFDLQAANDSVTDFIVKVILKLDRETQNIVKAASCIGHKFSLSTIKLINDKTAALENAVNEGIFVVSTNGKKYQFAHDGILQAARTLIPSQDRLSMYLCIGRQLKEKTLPFKIDENENLFIMVHLMNSATDLILDATERVEVAKLNLSAGIKAMALTAFKPASEYLSAGINVLGSDHWIKNYELTLQLYNAAAKAAYCSKDPLSLQSLTVDIFVQANSLQDKMHSYSLHIKVLFDTHKYQEMINVGLNVLNQLGEQFPAQPSSDFVKQKLFEVSGRIVENSFNILTLRTMENDYLAIYKMKIFSLINQAAYFVMPTLLSLIGIRMVELTLANGTCKYSAIGFSLVASDLCNHEKVKEGYSSARLALRLTKMCPSKEILPTVYLTVYSFVIYWAEHIHLALEPYLVAARTALETGCNELSCLHYSSYYHGMLCSGGSLTKVEDCLDEVDGILKVKKKIHLCINQVLRNYLGKGTENSAFLTGDIFDLRNFDPKDSNGSECALIYLHSIMLAFYFHEYDKAKEYVETCRQFIHHVDRELTKIYFIFYAGMTNLAVAIKNKQTTDGKWKEEVKEYIAQLRKYAEISPINFLNKLRILEAGLEAFENNFTQATSYYKEAIILSKAHNFTNEEALALEQVGSFYLRSGEKMDAAVMLNEAYNAYCRWGASSKLSHLALAYPDITFEGRNNNSNFIINVGNSSSGDSVSDSSRPSSCLSQSLMRGSKRVRFSS